MSSRSSRLVRAILTLLCVVGTIFLPRCSRSDEFLKLIESTPDKILFQFTTGRSERISLPDGSETIAIEGCHNLPRNGEPSLPRREVLIGIPEGASIDVSFTTLATTRLEAVTFEEIGPEPSGKAPKNQVELTSISYMRNQRVASLIITPLEYDPLRKTALLTKKMLVSVSMKGGRVFRHDVEEAAFESIYRSSVLNYDSARAWRVRRKKEEREAPVSRDYFTSSQNWVKLYVQSTGLHSVTPSLLRSNGIDPGLIDPRTLRVFAGPLLMIDETAPDSILASWMEECAISGSHNDDNSFQDGEYIMFYALAPSGWRSHFSPSGRSREYYENAYTRYSVFWLTWGGSFATNPAPKRMEEREAASGFQRTRFESFPERIHIEENRFHDASLIESGVIWEQWWWESLYDTDPPVYKVVRLPKIDASEPVGFFARFWGASNTGSSDYKDHYISVMWNSYSDTIASIGWNGGYKDYASGRMDIARTIDLSSFRISEYDTIFIEIPLVKDPTLPSERQRVDQTYLAFFEFEYEKRLQVDSNRLGFSSPDSTGYLTYSLTGVTSASGPPGVYALDVTDWRNPVLIKSLTVNQTGDGTYRLDVDDDMAGSPRRYWISTWDGTVLPAKVEIDGQNESYLRQASEADYLIIVGDKLESGIEPLSSLRKRKLSGFTSPKVEVVKMSDIYDEFSWGMVDPTALRNFLRYAYWNWVRQPVFVVFVGDATRDFKDYEGTHIENLVPTYQGGYDQYTYTQYVTDDWFALMDWPRDNYLDLAIGRLPARDLAELRILLEKILSYEDSPEPGEWRNKVILVADDTCKRKDPDSLGWTHVTQTELLGQYLPDAFDRKKVYLTEFPPVPFGVEPSCIYESKPQAKERFIELINEGGLIANFVGHGGADLLADEDVFRDRDIGTLKNGRKLHLFISASCAVGKFDEPTTEGIGEGLMKFEGGGSIASFAATDLAFPSPNSLLNTFFFENMFPLKSHKNPRPLGMGTMLAKNLLPRGTFINSQKYALLGDPGLVLSSPTKEVKVEIRSDSGDTLKAGSRVNVRGEVLESGSTDTSFNGTMRIEVRDVERKRGTLPTPYYPAGNVYYLEGNPVFRGEFSVTGGSFSDSFWVPIELTPAMQDTFVVIKPGSGRVRAYAQSGGTNGVGIKYPVPVSRESGSFTDSVGPRVLVRFEGSLRKVAPRSKLIIRLSDESGINITRLKAENTIFLRMDRGQAVDLADRFEYDQGSFRHGGLIYTLPSLSLGPHKLSVTASDNFNNKNTVEMDFEIVEQHEIRTVFNFPNPFSEWTDISFELTQASQVTVRIFTVSGREIRVIKTNGEIGQNNVRWDGKDKDGVKVSNGLYIYKISASARLSQSTATTFGRAVVMR